MKTYQVLSWGNPANMKKPEIKVRVEGKRIVFENGELSKLHTKIY
jgi:hypothetical protein